MDIFFNNVCKNSSMCPQKYLEDDFDQQAVFITKTVSEQMGNAKNWYMYKNILNM